MIKEEKITWDCLLHGNVVKHDLFYRLTNKISWQKLYKLKISAFIYSGKRDNEKRDISKCFRGDGTFLLSGKRDILCSGRRDTLFSGKREILSSGNDFILWESGHLSSGNRTTYPLGFGTSSGKRDMGNGTLYPLGIGPLILWETGNSILWESGKGEMRYNPSPLLVDCPLKKELFICGFPRPNGNEKRN